MLLGSSSGPLVLIEIEAEVLMSWRAPGGAADVEPSLARIKREDWCDDGYQGTSERLESFRCRAGGGMAIVGGGIYCFEFRSLKADCRASFLFLGAGFGAGGSLGRGHRPESRRHHP